MRNIPFDIQTESVEEILIKVVLEVKWRYPGVQRTRLGEVWASPCCKTFCKLGVINKEYQFSSAVQFRQITAFGSLSVSSRVPAVRMSSDT